MGASAGTGMQTRRFAEGGATTGSEGTTQAAPQRAIYRPQYTDYRAGLEATPQAAQFVSQMPTFTRPQVVQQAPSYRVPYANAPDTGIGGLMGSFGRISKNFAGPQTSVGQGLQQGNLTEAQYDLIMSDPRMYLPYVQYVQAGNDPAGFQMAPTPNQFMTQGQLTAYNDRQKAELDRLIRPITYFEPDDQGGG